MSKDRLVKHGDAFELLSQLENNSAHAAVVDYPWEFIKESDSNGSNKFGSTGTGGEFSGYQTESKERLAEILSHISECVVPGGWVFPFSDDTLYPEFRQVVTMSELDYRKTLIWHFSEYSMGYYFRGQHMPIIAATVGETDRHVRDRGTVIQAPRAGWARGSEGDKRPTGKPVTLYRELLSPPVLSDDEQLLEPFCGGGPGAAIAAERGLCYWGCDVDLDAVDRTRDRLKQTAVEQWTQEKIA